MKIQREAKIHNGRCNLVGMSNDVNSRQKSVKLILVGRNDSKNEGPISTVKGLIFLVRQMKSKHLLNVLMLLSELVS